MHQLVNKQNFDKTPFSLTDNEGLVTETNSASQHVSGRTVTASSRDSCHVKLSRV